MASALYSDGYLQPTAQRSAHCSTVPETVNTTSLISIVSDVARDSSGRTVVWEADMYLETNTLTAKAIRCGEFLEAEDIFKHGFRPYFYDSFSYSIAQENDHIEFTISHRNTVSNDI